MSQGTRARVAATDVGRGEGGQEKVAMAVAVGVAVAAVQLATTFQGQPKKKKS
jgi:hypothetical protein